MFSDAAYVIRKKFKKFRCYSNFICDWPAGSWLLILIHPLAFKYVCIIVCLNNAILQFLFHLGKIMQN